MLNISDQDVREKVLHSDGNIIVSASAGTGKTHTIIEKIEYDILKIKSFQTYAVITFTRKATNEISNRLRNNKINGFVGTNDNFILTEIIRPFMYTAYGKDFKKEIKPDYSNDNALEDFEEGLEIIKSDGVICKYKTNRSCKNRKRNFGFQLALEILKKSHIARRYMKAKYFRIYIDEYQDSDRDMHNLFKYLYNNLKIPLFIVGDIKQSIYGWRGGYPDGFIELMKNKDFNTFTLYHNFRSNISIQNYSNIFMNDARENFKLNNLEKEVIGFRYPAENSCEAIVEYVKQWINVDESCAFLVRRNDKAEKISNLFKSKNLDFEYIPGSPLDNADMESEHIWIARSLANYIWNSRYSEYNFFNEIPMPESFKVNAINTLLKNINKNIEEKNKFLQQCKKLYYFLGYDDDLKIEKEVEKLFDVINDKKYSVTYNASKYKHTINTIHSSKGLQYEQIIILSDDYKIWSTDDEENELHYVAITRPKRKLLILVSDDMYVNHIEKCVKSITTICKTPVGIEDVILLENH